MLWKKLLMAGGTLVEYLLGHAVAFDGVGDYMSRIKGTPTNALIWTISFWAKRGEPGVAGQIVRGEGASTATFSIYFDATDSLVIEGYDGSFDIQLTPTRRFSDPAAWYHVCLSIDSTPATPDNTSCKLFINGVQETAFDTEGYPTQNETTHWNYAGDSQFIGWPGVGSSYLGGELAEFVSIDGTAYDADSFGEFNATTGKWVPISPSGLTFGDEGFRLDFADSNHLGKDAKGSAPDATAYRYYRLTTTAVDGGTRTAVSEFQIMSGGVAYPSSDMTAASTPSPLVASASTEASSTEAAWKAFDGTVATANGWMTSSGNNYGWLKIDLGSGNGVALDFIKLTAPGAGLGVDRSPKDFIIEGSNDDSAWTTVLTITGAAGWAVNDERYFGYGNDFTDVSLTAASQVTDTPTANERTWNPLYPDSGTYTNNNKSVSGIISALAAPTRTTFPLPLTGKHYFEVHCSAFTSGDDGGIGIAPADNPDGRLYNNGYSIYQAYNVHTYFKKYFDGTDTDTDRVDTGSAFIVGVSFDADARKVWFAIDDTPVDSGNPSAGTGEQYSSIPAGLYYPALYGTTSSWTGDLKVMEADQTYSPPTGFSGDVGSMSAQPEPAIPDPTKHFYSDVIDTAVSSTGTANFRLQGTGASEYLAIVKNIDGTVADWRYINTLAGLTKYMSSNATTAEQTDATMWSASGFDFTLGTSFGTTKKYLVEIHPAGLVSATATNSDGSITTTATSVNTTSGFCMSLYTGNNTGSADVGHGAGVKLEHWTVKQRTGTNGWFTHNKGMAGDTYYAVLNTTAVAIADATYVMSAHDATSITWGTTANGATNGTGDYFLFGWYGVEGYSAFGRYESNGSTDGPFLDTGFLPKSGFTKVVETHTNYWEHTGLALAAYNVMNITVAYNGNYIAQTSSREMDFLSNGVKIRNASNAQNHTSGYNYIYGYWGGTPNGNAR